MPIYNDTNLVIKVDPSKEREEYLHKQFMEGLYNEIRNGYEMEKVHYEVKRRRELGAQNSDAYGIIPNIGECVATYDARNWFRQMERDPDFWKCKQNRKKFKEDNPEVVARKG